MSDDDDVKATYSDVGRYLMKAMYSDDYLSIEGPSSTDALWEAAGATADSRVLDVGSGLGGPALHLADRHRARVTGLDLVEGSIDEVTRRAEARGLAGRADFRCGDATSMPFDGASFDLVWGQDAWYHVPGKDKLIAEAARVLAPGGSIAFTDWIRVGEMTVDTESELLSAIASPDIAAMDDYRGWLAANGLQLRVETDISPILTAQYRDVVDRLEGMTPDIGARFGDKVANIVLRKNRLILAAFEAGGLSGCMLVATTP